jgi:hypothetical protein
MPCRNDPLGEIQDLDNAITVPQASLFAADEVIQWDYVAARLSRHRCLCRPMR